MSQVSSTGRAKFAIEFDNGIRVSIIFGSMSYSDNHDMDWANPAFITRELKNLGMQPEPQRITSNTVEIMVFGNTEFEEWFENKYNGNPAGYIPANLIPSILQRAKSFKSTPEDALALLAVALFERNILTRKDV